MNNFTSGRAILTGSVGINAIVAELNEMAVPMDEYNRARRLPASAYEEGEKQRRENLQRGTQTPQYAAQARKREEDERKREEEEALLWQQKEEERRRLFDAEAEAIERERQASDARKEDFRKAQAAARHDPPSYQLTREQIERLRAAGDPRFTGPMYHQSYVRTQSYDNTPPVVYAAAPGRVQTIRPTGFMAGFIPPVKVRSTNSSGKYRTRK